MLAHRYLDMATSVWLTHRFLVLFPKPGSFYNRLKHSKPLQFQYTSSSALHYYQEIRQRLSFWYFLRVETSNTTVGTHIKENHTDPWSLQQNPRDRIS